MSNINEEELLSKGAELMGLINGVMLDRPDLVVALLPVLTGLLSATIEGSLKSCDNKEDFIYMVRGLSTDGVDTAVTIEYNPDIGMDILKPTDDKYFGLADIVPMFKSKEVL